MTIEERSKLSNGNTSIEHAESFYSKHQNSYYSYVRNTKNSVFLRIIRNAKIHMFRIFETLKFTWNASRSNETRESLQFRSKYEKLE